MQKPKILIIDEEMNITRIKRFLNGQDDWEIQFVSDPKLATRILARGEVAVVICGLDFKGIDCLSLPYEINRRFEDINVILLSLRGKEVSREEYLRTTAFDLVQVELGCPAMVDLVESIEVAVKAKRMKESGSIKRPVFEGGKI